MQAYSIKDHDIATLIAADKYSRIHQQHLPVNTSRWPYSDDGSSIDLNQYPARIKANI
ncbi:hypothetical protein [Acinetobacter sp. YH12097]|uniref:hypothetical protein n=1 Tax=Acinetobacter sp. YH12097 TaxID=2601086 RepID=UPI00211DF177|nr:hypothetical protein [Acinetobacter sp. YH12097]